MPIPDFNELGLLPPGIHNCSLNEVGDRFGQFKTTDKRCDLYEKLITFVNAAKAINTVIALIIDGSFVTSEDRPGDIDLILVLSKEHDFGAEPRPVEYNVLSRKRVQKNYKFDVLPAQEDSQEYNQYIEYFQGVKYKPGYRKGILRVQL